MAGHEILLNLAGAVALLLWGVRMVRTGIERAWGGEMRRLLARASRSSVFAALSGMGVAGALQSATAAGLLISGAVGKGLLSVSAGIVAVLGADVGSTLVVQLLSFNVKALAPAFLFIGVVLFMSSHHPVLRQAARGAVGLGLMLLSLRLIVESAQPLAMSEGLTTVMQGLSSDPILAVLLGTVLAWAMHSSVAMVLLSMSLTASGVLPLTLGLALVLGANIGGALIAVILTLRAEPSARRPALANLLVRGLGVIVLLPLLTLIQEPLLALDDSAPRALANLHTAFNLALLLVFAPLARPLARLTEKILPARLDEAAAAMRPRYLDESIITRPALALGAATREVLRMADAVEQMLREVMNTFEGRDQMAIGRVSQRDDEVDALHEAIKLYLTKLSRQVLSENDSKRCVEAITFTTNLEHIGDIIDKNLLDLAAKKVKNKLTFSEQGWSELRGLHERVLDQMQRAMTVFVSQDLETARQMIAEKDHFRQLERDLSESHLDRLKSGRPESIETSALHLDILRDLKRINSHLTSVAYPLLDATGELRGSRLRQPKDAGKEASPAPAEGKPAE